MNEFRWDIFLAVVGVAVIALLKFRAIRREIDANQPATARVSIVPKSIEDNAKKIPKTPAYLAFGGCFIASAGLFVYYFPAALPNLEHQQIRHIGMSMLFIGLGFTFPLYWALFKLFSGQLNNNPHQR